MNPPDLFSAPLPRPVENVRGFRERPAQEENQESVEAAISMHPTAGTLRALVLDYLRSHGPATDEQIADALGMSGNTERPRRVELERAGLVVRTGTGRTRSGRAAAEWSAA